MTGPGADYTLILKIKQPCCCMSFDHGIKQHEYEAAVLPCGIPCRWDILASLTRELAPDESQCHMRYMESKKWENSGLEWVYV